ncbi:hypothetical protein AVEN_111639-1 [Araneus ventricosus]|uniref:Uncharacterized protein n=1 Tax=Araneus ventricosus TaxID=182803 RepID=A0A4Y2C223_ARAVE|nr:hypothetical protein AVEN_111639-1 [Araneus ventricosus]
MSRNPTANCKPKKLPDPPNMVSIEDGIPKTYFSEQYIFQLIHHKKGWPQELPVYYISDLVKVNSIQTEPPPQLGGPFQHARGGRCHNGTNSCRRCPPPFAVLKGVKCGPFEPLTASSVTASSLNVATQVDVS